MGRSRDFWDQAARKNAAWFVATGHSQVDEAFFAQGAAEADTFLQFCDARPGPGDVVLEIGCGVGRMTKRLAQVAARVVATDVSPEMLQRCATNLEELANVDYVLVDGDGELPCGDETVDVVFSYITLQHVPTRDAQLRYLRESVRVLRPGGRLAVQVRGDTAVARAHDWAGHLVHTAQGRWVLSREWRGARIDEPSVAAALGGSVSHLELRRWGHRHSWVVGTKT